MTLFAPQEKCPNKKIVFDFLNYHSCADCLQENGIDWCNGDCDWISEQFDNQCLTVVVSLANEMLNENGFLSGIYEFATIVDGKPSYVNDDYAIWYDSSNSFWHISGIESIGQNTAYLWVDDNFSGLTDENNEWKYYFQGNRD